MKSTLKTSIKEYLLLILGNFIFALGAVMLVEPYGFAPGGTYGLGIVFHHLWGVETEFAALCMDVPLLILGFFILGNRFGIKTIVSTILLPLFMQLLHRVYGYASLIEPNVVELAGYQHQIIASIFVADAMNLLLSVVTSPPTSIVTRFVHPVNAVPPMLAAFGKETDSSATQY